MVIFAALLFLLLAGGINGSFALPTKYVAKWKFENIWLVYGFWAFIILPWVGAVILAPQILTVYIQAPWHLLFVIILGGLLFGIGQICFALAMNMIGLGLGFAINLGLSIGLGTALPLIVQHRAQIATPFGIITLIGCVIAISGLIFSCYAGSLNAQEKNRMKELEKSPQQRQYLYAFGIILAIIAGLGSAGQNFSFSYTWPMQDFAIREGMSQIGAAKVMWPGFLLCAFIPYIIYMVYLQIRNKSFVNHIKSGVGKYYSYAFIMGLFWYGSVVLYSNAARLIGPLGPVVGWPLFMILIILVSNFWGWYSGEWTGCSKRVKHTMWIALLLLVVSVIVLGYSSAIHP